MPATPNGTNTCTWVFDENTGHWVPTDHCDSGFQCGHGPNDKTVPLSQHEMAATVHAYNLAHGTHLTVPHASANSKLPVTLSCEAIPHTPN